MSDGKSDTYELERIAARRAAEQERRAVLNALETISRLEARHRLFDTLLIDAEAQFNKFEISTRPQAINYSAQMTSSTLSNLADKYKKTLTKAETQLAQEVSRRTTQEGVDEANSQLGSIEAIILEPQALLEKFASGELPGNYKQKRTSKKQLSPLLSQITEGLPPRQTKKIDELILKYEDAGEHEASLIRYELSGCIVNGQKQMENFTKQRPIISDWLEKFSANTKADKLFKERVMQHFISREEVSNAIIMEMKKVLNVQEQTLQNEDTLEAARIIEESLASLGYQTNTSVKAVFDHSQEEAWFQHEGWGPYYVCLRRFGDNGLSWRVILDMSHQDALSPNLNSLEIKETFCEAYPEIIKSLNERGMPTQQLQKLASSNLPVEKRYLDKANRGDVIGIRTKKKAPKKTSKFRSK